MNIARHIFIAGKGRFTMVELILVMVLMLVAAAMVTPSLARFGKHRAVLEEARRLVAASRWAGSEAGARGIYMEMALDAQAGMFTVQPATGWPTRNNRPLKRVLGSGVLMLLPDQPAQKLVFHSDGTVEGEIPETITLRDRFDANEEVILAWEPDQSSYVFEQNKTTTTTKTTK
jgi:type II secretory pathway pseudopilin PulG